MMAISDEEKGLKGLKSQGLVFHYYCHHHYYQCCYWSPKKVLEPKKEASRVATRTVFTNATIWENNFPRKVAFPLCRMIIDNQLRYGVYVKSYKGGKFFMEYCTINYYFFEVVDCICWHVSL